MVRYTAPVNDCSGYAEAARNNICALLTAGVNLTVNPISFEPIDKPISKSTEIKLIQPLLHKKLPYKINIFHFTPDNLPRFMEKGKYNISFTVWETDKLPGTWVDALNMVNEVWVPCAWNVKVFKESGVKPPVYCFPHSIAAPPTSEALERVIGDLNSDTYIFYSIFQYLERKNPHGLLIAYLTEFGPDDKVCLVVKTHRLGVHGVPWEEDKRWIKEQINAVKSVLHLPYYPPIQLISNLLSTEEMWGLYKSGDCFVLPSRSEGFSLTHMSAMVMGKPVIGTNFSGMLEFMNHDNALLVDYQLSPVFNMSAIYTGHQLWSSPSIMDIRAKMRWAYEHKEEAARLGARAREYILSNYSWEKIGTAMANRLKEIGASYE